MKNIRLHPLVAILAGVFAQGGMAADSPFSPFAHTPLIMQATPGTAPPPNVLVFIDNSYDGARHAKSNAPAPIGSSNNNPFGNNSKDLRTNIAKRAVAKVAGEYPKYRWGVSAYSPNNLSMKGYIGGTGLCFEPASWYNSAQLGCTFVTDFGADITQKLHQHEAGSQLVLPIKTRDPEDYKVGGEFANAVYAIPVWGGGSAAHASPLTTAYYEMTRYYRGMRTAYKKPIPEYASHGAPETYKVEVYSNEGGTDEDGNDTDCWNFSGLTTGGSAKFGKGIMLGQFAIKGQRAGVLGPAGQDGLGGPMYAYPSGQGNTDGYIEVNGPHGKDVTSDLVCGVPLKVDSDAHGEFIDKGWAAMEFSAYRVDILTPGGNTIYEYNYPFERRDGELRLKKEIADKGTVLKIYRIGRPHLLRTETVVGGGQYVSPIQYRCQSNNIVVITSAKDFFLSDYIKEKRGFYEAYHTDPLYKHDHPKYSQPYNGGFKRLVTADLIGEAPSSLVGSEQAKKEKEILVNYNNVYYPSRYKGDGKDYYGLGPAYSLKQYVQTMRKGEMERYNPYMDVVEDISADAAALRGIHDLDGQNSTGVRWSSAAGFKKHENVYLRNAYNERTGLESYAHLAQAGDIVAKGSEYIYPAALTPNITQSTIHNEPSGYYGGCRGNKCLIYQDPETTDKKSKVSDKDGEGKAWDGTDDVPDKTEDASGNQVLVDYKETFGRQRINTFTIGFGLVEATPSDFPVLTINRFGIAGQPYFTELGYIGQLTDQQRENHRTLTIGNVLLVQNKSDPLAQDCAERAKNLLAAQQKKLDKDRENYAESLRDDPEKDEKLKVFDQEISEEKARYQKEAQLKEENCGWVSVKRKMTIRENGVDKVVPGKEIRTTTGPISGTLYLAKENGSYYLYLDYDIRKEIYIGSKDTPQAGLKVGDKVKLVSSEAYKNLSDPSIAADEMLRRTAQKGGGAYFSMNVADEDMLVKNLRNILDQIDVGLVSMRVGAGIATNDTSSITSAVSTTLDAQRWLSELRFYELDPKTGKIKARPKHKVADYGRQRVNLFNTPLGLKMVTVNGSSAQIEGFSNSEDANRVFGINKNNANLGGLGISVSSYEKEYENLLKWLTRATPDDRADIFKRRKTDSSGPAGELIYRDRDPNNAEAKGAMARYMGDVLDSNIDLFGVPETGRKNKPYLAIGSNDGMLHILQSADSDNAEKPYIETATYVPGTAQRQSAQDTVLNNLVFTAEKNYGSASNSHQYFVNGKLFYRETDEKDGKRGLVTLTGTLGQGGRAAYALRIGGVEYHSTRKAGLDADSGSLKEQLPLWDTASNNFGGASTFGANASLGYTIGGVQVGRVFGEGWTPKYDPTHISAQNVRYATFLSSGFDAPSDKTRTYERDVKPSLYVLDHLGLNVAAQNATTGSVPTTADRKAAGSLIAKIETTDETVAGKKYGLAEPVFVDLNRDGISDLVYAGDQQGNMWRFDLRGTKDRWNASKVFQGNGQPITTAPTVYYRRNVQKEGEREVIVLFGTGSVLYQSDMKDTSLQTFYGVYDKVDNGCYTQIGENYQYNNNRCVAQTVKAGDLLTQTITEQGKMTPTGSTEPVDYRIISKNKFDAARHKGWKVDLTFNNRQEGERVVVNPVVVASPGNNSASVIFATRIFHVPEKDETKVSCTPDMVRSKSWLMALDARSGSEPGIVNLGFKVKNHDKRDVFVAGYSVAGAIMNLVMPSKYNDEINDQSAGREGQAAPLGEVEERPICEDGTVEIAFGIAGSNSDIGKHAIICAPIPDMRRLSWRELF